MGFENWEEVKLEEVVEINPSTTLKKGTDAKKVPMDQLKEFTRKIQGFEVNKFSSGSKFQNEDTLFARITPCLENGKTAFVDVLETNEIAFGSTEFFVLRAKKGISDPKFIYYLSISDEFRQTAIQSMTGTSGRQRAQKEALLEYKFRIPSFRQQQRIGNTLSKLDEKIELNNSLIFNLEQLAQTLFKRWFVDFEFPNENGDPYKSSGGEMVESELGMIPAGWGDGVLSDIGSIVGGGTPSKKIDSYYTKQGYSWITPKDLSNDKSIYIFKGNLDITEEALKRSSAKLHPANTVLFSSRAPIGYVAIAGQEVATNQGFKSIIPKKEVPSEYVFLLLKYLTPVIESNASGSTFKEISGSGMKGIKVVVPPKAILADYESIVKPLFKKVKETEIESRSLIVFRDTLLPKLLSGEIELPNETEVTEDVPIS